MTSSLKPHWDDAYLWWEDVVCHVPDSLCPVHISVAHTFHFGEDGADCCVCGLVAFLIDEHPPGGDIQLVGLC